MFPFNKVIAWYKTYYEHIWVMLIKHLYYLPLGHNSYTSSLLDWFFKIGFGLWINCSIGGGSIVGFVNFSSGSRSRRCTSCSSVVLLENSKLSGVTWLQVDPSHTTTCMAPLSSHRRVVIFHYKHSWSKEKGHCLSCRVGVLGDWTNIT